MSGIICAVRGGPDSQSTIQEAISLALEVDLPLYFLYIVNLDFLSHTQVSKTHTISDQLHHMGEFILLTAQEQAAARGVKAEQVIRQGNVREEIVKISQELEANYIVLGMPVGETEKNVFMLERIREFGESLEQESGASVLLVGSKTEE
jgi:nucleotide-binding universal stress UspA family protein